MAPRAARYRLTRALGCGELQPRRRRGRWHSSEWSDWGGWASNIVRRLMRDGHDCVVYDISADAVKDLADEGAIGVGSLEEMA